MAMSASRKRGLEAAEHDAEQYAAEEAAEHDGYTQVAGESQALGTCKFCGSTPPTPKGCESCMKHWADQAAAEDWAAGAWTKPDTDSEDEDHDPVVALKTQIIRRVEQKSKNPPKPSRKQKDDEDEPKQKDDEDEPNIKDEPKQKDDEDQKVPRRPDRRNYRVPGTPVQHAEIKATLQAIKAEQDVEQALDDESQAPDF
jgi:hypothetical protein